MPRLPLKPTLTCFVLFVISIVYYSYAALNFPALFNLDNQLNYTATNYLAEHKKIPVVEANDKQITFSEIGTTRLLRPPFTFIVAATASNLFEGIIEDSYKRQRLGAPLLGALTIVVVFIGFWISFNHLGLALLGAVSTGLLPKFIFLSSCNNDDIGAILSVSLLFTSVLALIKHQAKTLVLFALALSLGLVLQTKYTAWLTLPWFGLFCLLLTKSKWPKIIKLSPILFTIFIAAGGWWVVFNMFNYGIADPSALQHAEGLQTLLSDDEANREGYLSVGIGLSELLTNHDQFLSKSYRSLIGYLEWIELDVGLLTYWFYGLLLLIGIFGVMFRFRAHQNQRTYLDLLLIALVLSQCAFYIHHNLLRDIQPQARYILPIIMPLVYLFLRQVQQIPAATMVLAFRGREYGFQSVASFVLLVICLAVHMLAMQRYVLPSYNSKPFFTSLKKPAVQNLSEALKVSSTESLSYQFIDNKLELQRSGTGQSSLTLSPSLCEQLPINALITMTVHSITKGGFNLHLDRYKRNTYESVYWRGVPSGQSSAVFSINSDSCSGIKISLSRTTYRLTIQDLEISELKIHQYGKPL